MYEVSWTITRDRTSEVMATTEARIDQAMQAGAERILAEAQSTVRTRTGATQESGRVEQVGPMTWAVIFGEAAIYLEFGTSHHPAYPFIVPSAQSQRASIFNDVNNAVGGRGAVQIGSDYLANAVATEGGYA